MDIDDYRAWRPKYSRYLQNYNEEDTVHDETSIIGLAAEAGELLGLVQKAKRNRRPVDREKVVDELGDVLWYMCYVMDAYNIDFKELTTSNKKKLDDRNK
jgi:NTP pyrophosphatase (non-canonical NTP hydrolase)